ncbi:LysR family transcriptional regulator [Luteipulveratus mongoliensis]|uniref:LysR family transcriptional regulator n=1 Tax=Luteipulveratus mongoliensis TaxID=571913 RepID=A0A0K1JQL4_9MICO|nr:LysR substrate-binding domain-containing protein [Luteipulveratus mongoliensis]AKU19017.1 LysR family transcriptional regulator [Luteipulveratus mongoliensis]
MELSLHRLWIFTQVIESGGFSAATEKLFMSQPSISNQIRQLETSVKATLIDRSGARIKPTAEGEVLLEYAKRLFVLADEAVTAIAQVSGLEVGRIGVGGTTTAGTYLLPAVMSRFKELHPGIEFDLVVGNASEVSRALLAGEIGLAVMLGKPTAGQLVSEKLLSENLVLVAPQGHPLAGAPLQPDQLTEQRFLLRERGSATRIRQDAALETWGLPDVARADIWGQETIKQAVIAGLGISLISEHAIINEVAAGQLAVLEVASPLDARPVVVATRRDRLLSPAEQAFLRVLRGMNSWPTFRPYDAADDS